MTKYTAICIERKTEDVWETNPDPLIYSGDLPDGVAGADDIRAAIEFDVRRQRIDEVGLPFAQALEVSFAYPGELEYGDLLFDNRN